MARHAFPGVHTDEQLELGTVVRAFLDRHAPETEVRRLMATEDGFDRPLWRRMATELGVQGLAIPEEYGGAGFGYVEAGLVFEETGRGLLCAPYFATVALAAEALLRSGDDAACRAWLPGIAAGDTVATLAIGAGVGRAPTVRAQRAGDEWQLTGIEEYVPDGHVADLILVLADDGAQSGASLFAVEAAASGLTRTALLTLDQTRKQARIALAQTPALLVGAEGAGAAIVDRTLATAAGCIQVHGGIGFTWEHPAHLYFKRAKSCEVLLGTPAHHRGRVAALLGL